MTSKPQSGRHFRSAAALVAALSAAALVAGCGSSGGGAKGAEPSQSSAPVQGAQAINPQPLSKIKQGGTFRMSIQQWITQYNLYQVEGTQGDGASIASMVLPQLWMHDAKGTPHADTDFLLNASAATAGGKQVVTYNLNPKAKWSDGKQVSAADFKAQWQALNGSDSKYLVADSSGYDQIASVAQGSSPQQVKVTFKNAYADWQRLFQTMLPAAAINTPDKFNKGWIQTVPITSGAWKIGKMDKAQQAITVVPDPSFWGTKPKLDKVIFRAMGQDAQLGAYLNNEIDYVSTPDAESYQRAKKNPSTAIRIGARWDEVHLTLNGNHGPTQDVKVRQAIEEAVNRQALADIASKGMPFKAPLLDNHFFMPNQAGYQDNAGQYGKYDPTAAGKLLDAAGWKSAGTGKPRTKGGKPLQLTYVMSDGSTQQSADQAEALQAMLMQVGIKMTIQKVPMNDFFDKYVNVGNFDLTSFRNVDAVFPSTLYPVFQQPKGNQVYQNYGRVSSPQIDKLLQQAGTTVDESQSRALYNQADKLIWQAGHSLEYYQRPQVLAVRKNIANFGASGLGDVDWAKVGFLK
ncbi:ABC transporter substrate-binding protein [Mangrovactinospora gilvigrisea]|uniref:ABC transporter substrate-binding protein n=1 Tax=Mangrovactinospora gilvigrisea TaxID=1428644 RepID=A0A1J7BHQ8_9ACTN|nr:ABC transporter family substrate-binding protein [Mangrovactinospora gilvigrisea]OIV38125.1 ABC transporter substrate-binding protein [Mangrovactinospora gilvigrisea]